RARPGRARHHNAGRPAIDPEVMRRPSRRNLGAGAVLAERSQAENLNRFSDIPAALHAALAADVRLRLLLSRRRGIEKAERLRSKISSPDFGERSHGAIGLLVSQAMGGLGELAPRHLARAVALGVLLRPGDARD